jgi:hypothetical protein
MQQGNNTNLARFALYKSENKYFMKVEGGHEREITLSEYNILLEMKERALNNFVKGVTQDQMKSKEKKEGCDEN